MIGSDIERGTGHRSHVERITPFSSARRELLESLRRRREQIIISVICVGVGLVAIWGLSQWNEAQYRDKVAVFSQQVSGKLSGGIPLSPGDKYYPLVKVVPAARTGFERSSIEEVHVRELPSVYSNDHIGTVFKNTVINNVVVVEGEQIDSKWGAFLCTDITQWAKPPLTFDSLGDRICTIDVDFLKKVEASDGSINYGGGVIGPSRDDQQKANQLTPSSK